MNPILIEAQPTRTNPKRRRIQLVMDITSGQENYQLCELVEQTILNGSLNNNEFNIDVREVKVVG